MEKGSQTEPRKRSRRFYIIIAASILTLAVTVGFVIAEWYSNGQTSYGPGPVYIDKVVTDKPYYLQGEKVNVTVTVNNPQNWSVVEPSYIGFVIEHDGFPVDECGVNIDYAWPPPTFPPRSKTLYNPPSNLSLPGRPGNYTIIVSFDGMSNGSCRVEVRPNPAGFNGTESLMAGDWIKYDISASWIGSGTQPSSVTEFKQILWEMDRVQIAGDPVVNTTLHFKNGTEQFWMLAGGPNWLIFPSALKKGDTLQLYASAPGIYNFRPDYSPSIVNVTTKDTVIRTYVGSTRSVDVLTLTRNNSGADSGTLYWDQETGILLEIIQRSSLPGGIVEWSFKASATNIWEP